MDGRGLGHLSTLATCMPRWMGVGGCSRCGLAQAHEQPLDWWWQYWPKPHAHPLGTTPPLHSPARRSWPSSRGVRTVASGPTPWPWLWPTALPPLRRAEPDAPHPSSMTAGPVDWSVACAGDGDGEWPDDPLRTRVALQHLNPSGRPEGPPTVPPLRHHHAPRVCVVGRRHNKQQSLQLPLRAPRSLFPPPDRPTSARSKSDGENARTQKEPC